MPLCNKHATVNHKACFLTCFQKFKQSLLHFFVLKWGPATWDETSMCTLIFKASSKFFLLRSPVTQQCGRNTIKRATRDTKPPDELRLQTIQTLSTRWYEFFIQFSGINLGNVSGQVKMKHCHDAAVSFCLFVTLLHEILSKQSRCAILTKNPIQIKRMPAVICQFKPT